MVTMIPFFPPPYPEVVRVELNRHCDRILASDIVEVWIAGLLSSCHVHHNCAHHSPSSLTTLVLMESELDGLAHLDQPARDVH